MDVREKMVEILSKPIFPHELADPIEAVFCETNMEMVLQCFDNAVKDWRRLFCDVENCNRK